MDQEEQEALSKAKRQNFSFTVQEQTNSKVFVQ